MAERFENLNSVLYDWLKAEEKLKKKSFQGCQELGEAGRRTEKHVPL